jgi:hypothetical protein
MIGRLVQQFREGDREPSVVNFIKFANSLMKGGIILCTACGRMIRQSLTV